MYPLLVDRHPLGVEQKGLFTEQSGYARVRQGTAIELVDEKGRLIGFLAKEQSIGASPSPVSSRVLSRGEMELIAGATFRHGGSRTVGLTEQQRTSRVFNGRILPAEDAVELAQVKQQAFLSSANYATGDKAVRVYPPKPKERR